MDKHGLTPTDRSAMWRFGLVAISLLIGLWLLVALVGNVAGMSQEMVRDYSDMKRAVAEARARTERRIDERRTLRTRLLRQCMAERAEYVCLAMVEESVDAALPVAEQYRGVR